MFNCRHSGLYTDMEGTKAAYSYQQESGLMNNLSNLSNLSKSGSKNRR